MGKTFFLFLFFLTTPVFGEGQDIRHIFLVRHAEYTDNGTNDPSLSQKGLLQAKALAKTLERVDVKALVVSKYKRTQETGKFLAQKLAEKAHEEEGFNTSIITEASDIANFIRGSEGDLVVVGHSNTVPSVIRLLGGPSYEEISHNDYEGLYILTLEGYTYRGLTVLSY